MDSPQSRRDELSLLSFAGAAGFLGSRTAFSGVPKLETTSVRLSKTTAICLAPTYFADRLLQTEGFENIQYISTPGGLDTFDGVSRGEIDFGRAFAASVVSQLDAAQNITALAGIPKGCYELFSHEPRHTIADLKGKRGGTRLNFFSREPRGVLSMNPSAVSKPGGQGRKVS